MGPTILSIQSWVSTGHVGNAAAVFPLQRLGAQVWAVHTVQFSNHPGHGSFQGQVLGGAAVRAVIDGIEARGLLPRCDAVLSGYLGDAETGEAVLHAVARVRAANPRALYCCDPVIGDAGRVFVRPGIPELLSGRAVPLADVLTPNQFELSRLTGEADPYAAIPLLCARMAPWGRRTLLVTSLRAAGTPAGSLDIVAAEPGGTWRLRVPLLPAAFNGAGDCIAALFLLHLLRTGSARRALELAGSAIAGLLARTAAAAADELLLIEAQEEFVAPSTVYAAERVA
jgi:pyridoxine kinase